MTLAKVSKQHGFTLIELLMVMAITAIIVAAAFSAYTTQQKTYLAQDQVAEMQQNLRAAVDFLSREIRTAGLDPTGKAGATITTADHDKIRFTKDINGDEDFLDLNETVELRFIDNMLQRQIDSNPYETLVENIETIEFLYRDSNGNPPATPGDVRSVTISLLARAGRDDSNFNKGMADIDYTAASGVWTYTDNYRRRLLITTIQCRNMGL